MYGICFSVNRFGKPFIKLLIHARRVNKGPFAFFLAAASDLGPEKQGMVYRMQRATPREGHGPRRANGIMGKEGYGVGVRGGEGGGGPGAGREESGSHAGMNQAMKSGIMTADMCRSPERGPGPDTQHRPSSSQRALGCGCAVMVEETAPATEVTRWTSHSQQVAWPDLDPRASTSRTHSLGHRTPA